MNILIIKPSSLGDIVHTFPAVELLRRTCPDAHISWVVNEDLSGMLDLLPGIDEVIPFKRKKWGEIKYMHQLINFIRELRQNHYDITLDFQGLLRSGLISYFSGAPKRVGFGNAREGARFFYTDQILIPANLKHAVDKNTFLIQAAFGISEKSTIPELKSQHDFRKCAKKLCTKFQIDTKRPILAIAPAARWQSKKWSASTFAKVIDTVTKQIPELTCWILGTQEEYHIGEKVINKSRTKQIKNLMGTTNFGTLVEMLRLSNALLTNDSGPMHIGAAIKTPTIALFSSTDYELTGPYGDIHSVIQGKCEQAPCFQRTCPLKKQVCTTTIPIQEIAEQVIAKLKENKQHEN